MYRRRETDDISSRTARTKHYDYGICARCGVMLNTRQWRTMTTGSLTSTIGELSGITNRLFHFPYSISFLAHRYSYYPRPKVKAHPQDCSVMTYRGHSVMSTLIRCHFSPAETTGSQYIYSGSADGRIHVSTGCPLDEYIARSYMFRIRSGLWMGVSFKFLTVRVHYPWLSTHQDPSPHRPTVQVILSAYATSAGIPGSVPLVFAIVVHHSYNSPFCGQ